MRIKHTSYPAPSGYRAGEHKRRSGKVQSEEERGLRRQLFRLVLSVVLFLAAWSGQRILPEQTAPVFEKLQQVICTNSDLTTIAAQAGAVVSGEEPVLSVFRVMMGAEEGETQSVSWQSSPHWQSEVACWQQRVGGERYLSPTDQTADWL